jgi:subtilisin family serine protease
MRWRSEALILIGVACSGGLALPATAGAQNCPPTESAEKFVGGSHTVTLDPSRRYETLTFISDQGLPIALPGDEVVTISDKVRDAKLGTVLEGPWLRQFGTVLVLLNPGVSPADVQSVAHPRLVAGGDKARQSGNPIFDAGSVDHLLVNQIIVQFHPQASPQDVRTLLDHYCARVVKQSEHSGRYLLTFDKQTARHALAMANRLNKEKTVLFAQPDMIVIADPNAKGPTAAPVNVCPAAPATSGVDPYYAQQWHLDHSTGQPGDPAADVNAPDAWGAGSKGNGILVAILDDAVETSHEDLAGQIQQTWNAFTETPDLQITEFDQHGTAVAGIVAMVSGNANGAKGTAPLVKLMPVRVVAWLAPRPGSTELPRAFYPYSVVVRGIEAATAAQARVINMSLSLGGLNYESCDVNNVCQGAVETAVKAAMGMPTAVYSLNPTPAVPVFPSGNDGGTASIAFPAVLAGSLPVIAVGATDPLDAVKLAVGSEWGSNQGPELSVVAPGVSIVTTDRMAQKGYCNTGNYVSFHGTSAATPIVAGVVALLQSQYVAQGLTFPSPQEIKDRLETTAKHFSTANNGFDTASGFGRVDACTALQAGTCPAVVGPGGGGGGGGEFPKWLLYSLSIMGAGVLGWWVIRVASKRKPPD